LLLQCATPVSDGAAVAAFGSRVSSLAAKVGADGSPWSDQADPVVCLDLLDRFSAVSDGRSDQARAHPVAAVLTLAAAAVVAGMRSLTAIAGWVLDVAPEVRERLYARCGLSASVPSRSTLWRVVAGADAAMVDAAVGAWLAAGYAATAGLPTGEQRPILGLAADEVGGLVSGQLGGDREGAAVGLVALMVDGKTVRGAEDADGHQVHLLAAATHEHGLVLAQTEVGAKTNEIPMFEPLLDSLDISGAVITADALHTQRRHAEYLHRRGADFLFMVKDNQPGLFTALDRLDWPSVPVGHASTDRAHGRIETRTIQLLPAPADLPFPHVEQVFLVERGVTDLRGKSLSNVAIFGVTSLDAHRAGATDLARFTRGHWGIESLHWIRDSLYREDESTIHTGSGPRVMASLRNLAIGALRLFGRNDITEATRWATRRMDRPFTVLGITTRS
jgi:predicted transposase YbfD/YdcC